MQTDHELLLESIQSAFDKLPQIEQDMLLFTCKNLRDGRFHPLSDDAKIEVAGKVGIWLVNRERRQE